MSRPLYPQRPVNTPEYQRSVQPGRTTELEFRAAKNVHNNYQQFRGGSTLINPILRRCQNVPGHAYLIKSDDPDWESAPDTWGPIKKDITVDPAVEWRVCYIFDQPLFVALYDPIICVYLTGIFSLTPYHPWTWWQFRTTGVFFKLELAKILSSDKKKNWANYSSPGGAENPWLEGRSMKNICGGGDSFFSQQHLGCFLPRYQNSFRNSAQNKGFLIGGYVFSAELGDVYSADAKYQLTCENVTIRRNGYYI